MILSVAYAATSLVNVNDIADPALNQVQMYIQIGLALNVIALFLSIITISLAGRANQMVSPLDAVRSLRAEVGLLTIAFLLFLAGSVLLLIAAGQVNQVVFRFVYIFTLSAGIFGIIGAVLMFIQWCYRVWVVSKYSKTGTVARTSSLGSPRSKITSSKSPRRHLE